MSDAMRQWARLADADHLRRTLIDASAFLVAYASLTDFCVRSTHGLLSKPGSAIASLGEAEALLSRGDPEQLLARCDPDRPTAPVVRAAIQFFVEGGAFSAEDVARLERLTARRDEIVARMHLLLAEDPAGELLGATLEIRDLLRSASRWWFLEVEAAIAPELLRGQDSEAARPVGGTELILDFVLRVAQNAAEPG
ncbi:MAG: hypothetical protein ACR2IP_12460 [Solirubrobacteraceae bacterium]